MEHLPSAIESMRRTLLVSPRIIREKRAIVTNLIVYVLLRGLVKLSNYWENFWLFGCNI